MAEIICYSYYCKYWQEGNQCSCPEIEISEDNECDSYVDYRESEEWQTPFWKAMHDGKDNKIGRVKYFGKEIEIEGRKFFIESKNSYTTVTDKETGLNCGELWAMSYPDRIEKIAEVAKIFPPVMSLPPVEYNEETGELTFVEESEEDKKCLHIFWFWQLSE